MDCVGLEGLPLVGMTGGYLEWLDLLGLGLDALGEEAEWLLDCLGKKEEVEVAPIVVFGDVSESLLVSVVEMED